MKRKKKLKCHAKRWKKNDFSSYYFFYFPSRFLSMRDALLLFSSIVIRIPLENDHRNNKCFSTIIQFECCFFSLLSFLVILNGEKQQPPHRLTKTKWRECDKFSINNWICVCFLVKDKKGKNENNENREKFIRLLTFLFAYLVLKMNLI